MRGDRTSARLLTSDDRKNKGGRAKRTCCKKKAPLQARARGVATARSARVGKLSPIRTLFNVRLAALFHEKGRRPKPTPLCQLQRSRAYEGDLVSRVSGPCEKGECHQRSYGPAHLLTSRVGSRAAPSAQSKQPSRPATRQWGSARERTKALVAQRLRFAVPGT